MDFQQKFLYHQIHPLKFSTDIGVTPIALYFLWQHRPWPALLIGFTPPILVSLGMLKWPPDLEKLKQSKFGQYVAKYMTPFIQMVRFLTLIPMAYGAWNHSYRPIIVGIVILILAWCNGLIRRSLPFSATGFNG